MHSQRTEKLLKYLSKISPVAVALSGGLDSSVVATAARLASDRSVAVTIDDYTLPRRDFRDARRVARLFGINHIVLKTAPPRKILDNPKDRCFHCKNHSYGLVRKAAKELGIDRIVDGANADDRKDHRPGMRAAKSLGVLSPLLELGFGKKETRLIALELSLPVWDKPASACLSSRVQSGSSITRAGLARIENAEKAVCAIAGVTKVRVRTHDGLARIEVPREEICRLFDKVLIARMAKRMRRMGFTHITLDLEGYRPGGR
jgi:pyridinium-3,5-biscarboxylic acid mononucleotide sulfurtransferase